MSKTTANPKDLLPLTPLSFHILLALSDHSQHGYGILKEVTQMVGGKIKLSAGTLYNAINRLLKARLIMVVNKESPPQPTVPSEKNKNVDFEPSPAIASIFNENSDLGQTDEPQLARYYQITGLGQRTLEAEFRRMDEIARAAKPKPAFEGLSTIWRHAG